LTGLRRKKVLVLDPRDNVAVAISDIRAGEEVEVDLGGRILRIVAKSDIRFGHKIALKPIKRGEPVIKYGEVIGVATEDIEPGDHVHVHNVVSLRARRV